MTTPPLASPFGGQPQPQTQAARDVNTASLCRIGQETVQDIVLRTMEIFQLLRNMQVCLALGLRPLPSPVVLLKDTRIAHKDTTLKINLHKS